MDAENDIAMVAMLSASLALVRPVGMAEKETEDWLTVACEALAHLPFRIFADGARSARHTCTHHSQIVPTIIAVTREAMAWHNRPKESPVLRLVSPETFAPDEPLPEPESLMPSLQRIGLQHGWIVETPDGRLLWSKDTAA